MSDLYQFDPSTGYYAATIHVKEWEEGSQVEQTLDRERRCVKLTIHGPAKPKPWSWAFWKKRTTHNTETSFQIHIHIPDEVNLSSIMSVGALVNIDKKQVEVRFKLMDQKWKEFELLWSDPEDRLHANGQDCAVLSMNDEEFAKEKRKRLMIRNRWICFLQKLGMLTEEKHQQQRQPNDLDRLLLQGKTIMESKTKYQDQVISLMREMPLLSFADKDRNFPVWSRFDPILYILVSKFPVDHLLSCYESVI